MNRIKHPLNRALYSFFLLTVLLSASYAAFGQAGSGSADNKELSGISFVITHSAHADADYSAQAKAMSDVLTAAGAKVKLQTYNSKTREGIYGYYGSTETEKIPAVRKLVSKVIEVKFEYSKFYDEPGANPNRTIMIYLMRNKSQ